LFALANELTNDLFALANELTNDLFALANELTNNLLHQLGFSLVVNRNSLRFNIQMDKVLSTASIDINLLRALNRAEDAALLAEQIDSDASLSSDDLSDAQALAIADASRIESFVDEGETILASDVWGGDKPRSLGITMTPTTSSDLSSLLDTHSEQISLNLLAAN
jgi:sucrose-6-phosphate hydrolase SacC (GH32 family)